MDFPLTDAHCHIADGDLGNCADLAGMNICACSCYPGHWDRLDNFSDIPVKKAFGIHPGAQVAAGALPFGADSIGSALSGLVSRIPRADAVGEAGLDSRFFGRIPMGEQRKLFAAQAEVAADKNLPLIVHCVGAWGAALEVLRAERSRSGSLRFAVHAASCSAEMAAEFMKIGGYLSFGERELTSKRGIAALKAADLSRILTESDAADPSPEKILKILNMMAEFRPESASEIARAADANFKMLFN